MKILVINTGSSSLRYKLFEKTKKSKKKDENLLTVSKGMIDRIGSKGNIKNHEEAVKIVINQLKKEKFIKDTKEITAIGHRVVHGGEKYKKPTLITPKIIKEIEKLFHLAPIHNPANIKGIKAITKYFKNTKQVAVFDTSFHQTIDKMAYLYAIPVKFYKDFGIRKYGFHGTSHEYIAKETQKLLRSKNKKIITCHIGNGVSVTAIKNGKSIDTSMGFTPLEGLPMGTRCGDIDPAIVYKLMEKLKIGITEIDHILNKESGLLGLYGKSSDMRDIWAEAKKGNKYAKFIISYISYRLAKYIGAYTAILNGVDAIVFTAGIGENAWYVREETCKYLSFLGLKLDATKNKQNKIQISSTKSKVKVFIIPTDEEKEIAIKTMEILKT